MCVCMYVCVCVCVCVYIYIYMEYYSTIKMTEITQFAATWMDLENIILSKISQIKTNILYHLENIILNKISQIKTNILHHLYVESKK